MISLAIVCAFSAGFTISTLLNRNADTQRFEARKTVLEKRLKDLRHERRLRTVSEVNAMCATRQERAPHV